MKSLSRRSVTAGFAAAVTAIPAVGLCKGLEANGELDRLIAQHRAAEGEFGLAVDREEAARGLLRKGEPTVASGLGSHYSLYQGEDQCRRLIAAEWAKASWHLRQTARIAPVAAEAEGILEAKEAEAMARVDRAFADYNAVKADYEAADAAEADTLLAICSYRCRTVEEARQKAEYLLTTSLVKGFWPDEAQAVLESFVEARA
jgi:hypothetical protein